VVERHRRIPLFKTRMARSQNRFETPTESHKPRMDATGRSRDGRVIHVVDSTACK
jgi:hypothetical protein